jgi:hypothetical protein
MNADDEALKAQYAKEEQLTIFDKIVKKEIPANIIYEDELVRGY